VALVAGAGLLVSGAAMTAHCTRRWWRRLLMILLLVVVTAVSLWSGTQAVAATNVPPTRLRATTPADRGIAFVDAGFRTADGVRHGLADLLTDARPPTSLHDAAGAASPRPILLVAAGNVPDEVNAAQYIRRAAPGSVQIWQVPGTRHTRALATHPTEWERRVTAFLTEAVGT
jgi:hypothetical protein